MGEGEFGGLGNPRLEVAQQLADVGFLPAETGQQRQIDVNGLSRLAPALQSQSADEAELPALALANRLQFSGGLDNFIHGSPLS